MTRLKTRWQSTLTLVGAAIFLLFAPNASAQSALSLQEVIEFHDYERGPELVREHFGAAYRGETPSRFYGGTGCFGGDKLFESWDGVRDDAPIRITRIQLLGDRERAGRWPVYLVYAYRTIWLRDSFGDLSCAYLVTFSGNNVRSVLQAGALHYLVDHD